MKLLITGTNRGIGAALKGELTGRGHTVTGTHRGAPTADTLSLDVTDSASIAALGDHYADATLDGLVCNAGVYLDKGMALEDMDAAMWGQSLAANVTGVFLTIQAVLPALRRAQGAKIGIISSIMASSTKAPGGSYAYRASKAAALNLGRNIAADFARDGIAVQIFHPGWIQTDMGGAGADLTMDEAAPQLASRIEEIDIARTGAILTNAGTEIQF